VKRRLPIPSSLGIIQAESDLLEFHCNVNGLCCPKFSHASEACEASLWCAIRNC
jgi:hypothetical protein